MNIHKKIIIALSMLVPMLHACDQGHNVFRTMLHTFDQGHDFEYYKTKTIEILPVLGIDPSALSFIPVGHEPTIEERQENPNVVFLYVEKLNASLSTRSAVFECLVEAQLSGMSEKIWQSLISVDRRPEPVLLTYMPYVLLSPLACYCFRWLTHRTALSPVQEISFMVLTVVTTAASIFLLSCADEEPTISQKIKKNFERKKCCIQIDTIHALFNSYTYAPIAAYGAMLVRSQRLCDINDEGLKNMSHAFARWAQEYPDAFERLAATGNLTL
jgi:hypothetical protein